MGLENVNGCEGSFLNEVCENAIPRLMNKNIEHARRVNLDV